MANTNRTKGHAAERLYAQEFRDLGWPMCKTCRETSRLKDNCKIDLDFIPFNVQVKAGIQKGMKPNAIFTLMDTLLTENFPKEDPIHELPKILIHKKPVGRGKKTKPEHQLVYFRRVDFAKIHSKKLQESAIIHDISLVFSFCISIIDELVCMTWIDFKKLLTQ